MTPLLDVQDLTVVFEGSRAPVTAVDHVSFQLAAGDDDVVGGVEAQEDRGQTLFFVT